jgi:uncharacterized integral membrane protein
MSSHSASEKPSDAPENPDRGTIAHEPAAHQPSDSQHALRTRTGSAWVGLAAAALVAVALVIFMVQNTADAAISFLWMTGELPLGLILLIAVLGSILATMSLGTARILQLRRAIGRERREAKERSGKLPGSAGSK